MQGNYAAWDSSGLCHLMPQWHLSEWREEEERAFVHPWQSDTKQRPRQHYASHCQHHLHEVTIKWRVADSDVIVWFRPKQPQCINARSSSSLHSGRCHHGIISLCKVCSITEGNYATRDSSSMCHLMPQLHLPEQQEERALYTVAVGYQIMA